jgi:hypothetical protein
VTIWPTGVVEIRTTNRHEMASRWIETLKGKRHLPSVEPLQYSTRPDAAVAGALGGRRQAVHRQGATGDRRRAARDRLPI